MSVSYADITRSRQASLDPSPGAPHTSTDVGRVLTLLALNVCVLLTTGSCAARGPVEASVFAEENAGGTITSGPRTKVLTGAELGMAGSDLSLYDALRRLQPDVLQWRQLRAGETGGILAVVYVNGARAGDTEALRAIPVGRARKVQLIPADDAIRRYGSGHEAGAILVTMLPPVG